MKFAYEDLSDDQFEVLIVLLCQRLLGIAVQGFAKGPDGGRDAKFVGTAELHPSKTAPWIGTVIVQAKHTNGYNRSFSELDFYNTSSNNTVVGKEVPRIKKLALPLSPWLPLHLVVRSVRRGGNLRGPETGAGTDARA